MGRIVVVGSINVDVVAQTAALPVPGQTLLGSAVDLIPGGKGANQAVAAHRLDGEVVLVGALGSDQFSEFLRGFLENEGLGSDHIAQTEGATGTAVIVVDGNGQNFIVIIPGANSLVDPAAIGRVGLREGDILLLQNEVPEAVNVAAVAEATRAGATSVLNLAPYRDTSGELLQSLDYLVVNESEFASMLDANPEEMTSHRVCGLLAERSGFGGEIVVTLGAEGLAARIDGSVVVVDGHDVQAVDTTGAGDCFCGAFGGALASGRTAEDGLALANAAAALSVQRLGAGPSMPTLHEVEAFLGDQQN